MTKIFTALLTALLAAVSPLAYANGITLNVRDGQVRDVLASVAALSGKSIVADSSVQGTVTLNLKDVPFDTALRIITAAKGLSYRLTGDVILVGSAAGMEKFNDTASIIKLNYAKAEELKTALAPLIGTGTAYWHQQQNKHRYCYQQHYFYRHPHRRNAPAQRSGRT